MPDQDSAILPIRAGWSLFNFGHPIHGGVDIPQQVMIFKQKR
jgi:hypothetical protein